MKHSRLYLLAATALALGQWGTAAQAGDTGRPQLTEISDQEMESMRGRYTLGGDAIAWFGIKMISTWQSDAGQTLQGTLALSMDFSGGRAQPRVSFQPSVNITRAAAAMPGPAGDLSRRSVDGSGLANVGGMLQSVQIAGDGNLASNVTRLNVRDGGGIPGNGPAAPSGVASAYGDGASAVASFDGQSANLLLSIDGQGSVEQWIRHGSIGQSVQITADNQWVSNRMEIELVRQSVAVNAQLAQNVAQAIDLARGIGMR